MFDRRRFDNSRADGYPVLEVVDAEGPQLRSRRFIPLRRTELTGRISGPLADIRLTQVFAFSRDECDRILEALYRFPLPGDAAVTGVTVSFGGVEIRAQLKERAQAEQDYEAARAEGRQAALASRESPDVFTLRVTGIEPDQEVRVVTSYVQLARPEGTGWTLRVPLTTAPRYVREDERGSRHAEGQPLAVARDPGHRFALDLTFTEHVRVRSATHALEVTELDTEQRVRLRDGEVLPDRDCVLSWTPRQEADRAALQVSWHRDPDGVHLYFLALVTPPSAPANRLAREVILLVDHSGSMSGAKWEASDWAVTSFLSRLTERDALALGLFHDTTRWLARNVCIADAANRQRAVEFLGANRDSGGTNLGVALEQALSIGPAPGIPSRHVLIVTDAEVSDSGRILRLVEDDRRRAHRRRVSVLCIDAAPNSLLAHELAERGGGVARFLTSSPEEEDITTALEEILQEWSAPAATGLQLEINRAGVEAAGHEVVDGSAGCAIDLADLPTGRSLWVAGRCPANGGTVSFRLTSAQGEIASAEPSGDTADAGPAIKALFGARRVLGLEYLATSYAGEDEVRTRLERLGYDPASLGLVKPEKKQRIYPENAREVLSKTLRELLVKESLFYGLASAETAFVAVRTEAGHAPMEVAVVANALPFGWADPYGGSIKFKRSAAGPAGLAPGSPALPVCAAAPQDLDVPPFLRRTRPVPPSSIAGAPASGGSVPGQPPGTGGSILWSGTPEFEDLEALLFDSNRPDDAARLPDGGRLTLLSIRFLDGLTTSVLDPDLLLLLYVEDAAAPRVRIRLTDLMQQGGQRPLNLRYETGQLLRLVLCDPKGVWAQAAPEIEISISRI